MSRGRAAVLAGLGAWTPPRVVTNDMLVSELDTSDEWIRGRTGIVSRHVVAGETTADLAVAAARRALDSAGLNQVELVVVATSTPDRSCPATAPLVTSRLGLGDAAAFDVGAVCAGFVYALVTAASLVETGVAGSALVIGADTFSTIMDPTDRTTRPIFGDGAGAVVLRAGQVGDLGTLCGIDLGSDGTGYDLITVPPDHPYFRMAGTRVYAHAVERMCLSAATAVDRAGWQLPDVDLVVPHQANSRIIAECATQLDLPVDRVVNHIGRVGNTVAASIPIALAEAAGRLVPGDRIVLTAFGGGLAWGAVALRWPDIRPRYHERGDAGDPA